MSTPAPALLLPLPVGTFYGAFYFAALLSTAFYGITCMQTFFYYAHYQNDPLRTKIYVAALWALNTVHEALATSGAYKSIMLGLVNPTTILNGSPDLVLQLLFSAAVAVLAQGYLVYRIYLFSRKNLTVPLIWVLLAILQLVTAGMYVGKSVYSVNGLRLQVLPIDVLGNKPYSTLGSLFLTVAAATDISIALCMTFLLIRSRKATRSRGTIDMLQRLIVFSVTSGIWTATFALLTVILLHVFSRNVLYSVFGIPICPVYCNSILSNLNARTYVGDSRKQVVGLELLTNSSVPVSDGSTRVEKSRGEMKSDPSKQGVWKTTEVFSKSDAHWSTPHLDGQV